VTDLTTLRPYFDRLVEDALVGAQGRARTPAPLVLASQDETADAIVADIPRTPHGRTGRWRLAVAAAAAVALIVATIVLVRTESDDGVLTPAGPGPSAPAPAPSTPSTRPPLPDGLTLLPPEGATPSAPETGQLLAPLPIPIWVYEDGRVISARYPTHDHWTGFLEQRLTPEGVELVRAEILALEPLSFVGTDGRVYACRGGTGNYTYEDGSRDVCESPGDGPNVGSVDPTNMYADHPQYQRLSELQYGAPSWLPASAWADPEPKPYAPTTYQVQISGDMAAMRTALPPEIAALLTRPEQCPFPSFGSNTLCFRVTTEEARVIAAPVRPLEPNKYDEISVDGGIFAGYSFAFPPYLPHGSPVWCCGG
jgi:hypothetical protein